MRWNIVGLSADNAPERSRAGEQPGHAGRERADPEAALQVRHAAAAGLGDEVSSTMPSRRHPRGVSRRG
jgi:hypothetical protein